MAELAAKAVRPKEACRLLGFEKDKLYILLNSGEIPSFLAGARTRLIPVAGIDAYLERNARAIPKTHLAMRAEDA